MPKGKGHRFSAKEDRQAGHIADSEMARGMSASEAKGIGYATINKRKSQRGKRKGSRA